MTIEERVNTLQGLSIEAVRIAHLFDKFPGLENLVNAIREMSLVLPESVIPALPPEEVDSMLQDGDAPEGAVIIPFPGGAS